jgi:hypothetical protein
MTEDRIFKAEETPPKPQYRKWFDTNTGEMNIIYMKLQFASSQNWTCGSGFNHRNEDKKIV